MICSFSLSMVIACMCSFAVVAEFFQKNIA